MTTMAEVQLTWNLEAMPELIVMTGPAQLIVERLGMLIETTMVVVLQLLPILTVMLKITRIEEQGCLKAMLTITTTTITIIIMIITIMMKEKAQLTAKLPVTPNQKVIVTAVQLIQHLTVMRDPMIVEIARPMVKLLVAPILMTIVVQLLLSLHLTVVLKTITTEEG